MHVPFRKTVVAEHDDVSGKSDEHVGETFLFITIPFFFDNRNYFSRLLDSIKVPVGTISRANPWIEVP